MKETKRFLSLLLALAMVVVLVPAFGVEAYAAKSETQVVSYYEPIYKEEKVVTSGVIDWNYATKQAIVVTSSMISWGSDNGTDGWYVVTGNNVQINTGIKVVGNVHLILADGCSISAIAAENTSKAGINVASGSSLTIYGQEQGTGKLTAIGQTDTSTGGAGIGGNAQESSGIITINGGTVTATGGSYGAGIGGGYGSTGENITINGGTITATGGMGGAGIGGGGTNNYTGGPGENITINGGTVTATGGSNGAGIGGGSNSAGSNITINGGTVTATGGSTLFSVVAGIGNGIDCTTSASSIKVNKNLILFADNGTIGEKRVSFDAGAPESVDVTASLAGMQYVAITKSAPKYLTFTNAQSADSTIKLTTNLSPTPVKLSYSTDGTVWNSYSIGNTITLSGINAKVLFKATTYNNSFSSNFQNYYFFDMTGRIAASGDITSLLNGIGGDASLSSNCFYNLFAGSTKSLITAPELPSTQLAEQCYWQMFLDCALLATAPELPSTQLAERCYLQMFSGCSSLHITTDGAVSGATKIFTCSDGDEVNDMFENTAGPFVGTPTNNETYYYISPYVAENTTTSKQYTSVQAAVNAATSGATIKLLANTTGNALFISGTALTLDLNGYVLGGKEHESVLNVVDGATLTITDSAVSSCSHYFTYSTSAAWTWNGDVTSEGAIEVESITSGTITGKLIEVKGGCITGGNANNGGAINIKGNSATLNMYSGNLVGNTASWNGGAVYNAMSPNLFHMYGGLIAGNKAEAYGGGVYNGSNEPAKISGGLIAGNMANRGGGMYNAEGGLVEISGGAIKGNIATYGGGAYNYGTTTMSGVTISNNTAKDSGGGVFCAEGGNTCIEKKCSIVENRAISDEANGAGISNSGELTISDGRIERNIATANPESGLAYGAGITHMGGHLKIFNSTIKDNQAISNNSFGGGLFIVNGYDESIISSSDINGNYACMGGGIYNGFNVPDYGLVPGRTTLESCSVFENMALTGAGIYNYDGTITVSGITTVSGNAISGSGIGKNVYLPTGKYIALSGLSSGANIGITTEVAPTSVAAVQFTTGSASDTDVNYFFSDNDAYEPIASDGALYLAVKTLSPTPPAGDGGSGYSAPTYTLTANNAVNGTVSASTKSTYSGNTVTLTVTPNKGWTLETITVKDAKGNEVTLTPVTYGSKYTFKMPSANVTVNATFMEDNTMLNYFVDVNADDYFYSPVLWAAENGITSGVDSLHFAPNAITTRAQMVTFLWRAAGSPAPKSSVCQFTDVESGSFYETAVIWSVEQGITKGTSETTFAPNAKVTRGQTVTFIARLNGIKDDATGYSHNFVDVNASEYYNNAVAYAYQNGITSGIDSTHFSPDSSCLRAQIVTFLYRNYVK